MNRRQFLKVTGIGGGVFLFKSCSETVTSKRDYHIEVISNRSIAHLIKQAHHKTIVKKLKTNTLIVGGGIAGLSAAGSLEHGDYLLCELDDFLGGSAASYQHNGQHFALGAHYDLAYPDYYGKEGLSLLERAGITQFNQLHGMWEFKDKQFVIDPQKESFCFAHGEFREDLLENRKIKGDFLNLLSIFDDQMPLPTRITPSKHHHLNETTFHQYLKQFLPLNDSFVEALDYMMKDDFGAGTRQVSALAGIHYFKCRPYYSQQVELFSPPNGNDYFVQKLAKLVPAENVRCNHLVYRIKKDNNRFITKVFDTQSQQFLEIEAQNIIYAGQKHALKYIFPPDAPLFANNSYAPWVIINLVINDTSFNKVYWQNEVINDDIRFLGFVNSQSQISTQKQTVLTAYYCFDNKDRKQLIDIENKPNEIVNSTVNEISRFLEKDISAHVEKVYLRTLGHAMPIPVPGYLFDDKNTKRSEKELVYAGVDNARLPVLFDALDSGIMATQLIK